MNQSSSILTLRDQPHLWKTTRIFVALGNFGELKAQTWHMVPAPSLPQYCYCGQPMCLDYVSYVEEHSLGVKWCGKIWILYMKKATGMGRRLYFRGCMGRLRCVIVIGSCLQVGHLVTHIDQIIQGRPLHDEGKGWVKTTGCWGPAAMPKIYGPHPFEDTGEYGGRPKKLCRENDSSFSP